MCEIMDKYTGEARREGREEGREEGRIQGMVESAFKFGVSREQAIGELMNSFSLSKEEANAAYEKYAGMAV